MFKLVVLSALFAIAAARPGLLHGHLAAPLVYEADHGVASGYEYSASVHAPDYVNHVSVSAPLVGSAHLIKAFPEAVSHQSQHIVHGKTLLTSHLAPAVLSYHAPIVHDVHHW